MAALTIGLLVAATLPAAGPTGPAPAGRWAREIAEAAERFAIPEGWIGRVIEMESGGRQTWLGRPVTSRAGAMGLMQLMPATWSDMRAQLGLGSDPYDPRDNILAGTAYLRAMYDRFGYPGLFAAYNAGPARYAAYLSGLAGLPAETRAYLAGISDVRAPVRRDPAGPRGLFAIGSPEPARPRHDNASALFIPLGASRAP